MSELRRRVRISEWQPGDLIVQEDCDKVDIRRCPDGREHDEEPIGTLGPYPVSGCRRCNTITFYPVPNERQPLLAIFEALERLQQQRLDAEEGP
jgi:hypothetical protein